MGTTNTRVLCHLQYHSRKSLLSYPQPQALAECLWHAFNDESVPVGNLVLNNVYD